MFPSINQVTKKCLMNGFKRICLSRYKSRISVEPVTSLVTDDVIIYGDGFQPNTPITVQATLSCEAQNLFFKSYAHVITTEGGIFNLSKQRSAGGTYTGVDVMGLFWSMVGADNPMGRLQTTNASEPLNYKFSVFNGHVNPELLECESSATITRKFLSDNVTRYIVKEGNIKGTMFVPKGNGPFPAIMTLYGGNKRRHVIEDAAAILANNGFITFAAAYFGVDDLPKAYATQPIKVEFFEEIIKYLKGHPHVKEDSIGVYGTSKGGDIALAVMSRLPNVKAVACINGCISSVGTTTTYQDKVVDMINGTLERAEFMSDGTINIRECLNDPRDEPSSIHPFQFSSADLLMVAGLDDHNWNSELFADIAKDRMLEVNKRNFEIEKCPGMGHFLDVPNAPVCSKTFHPLVPNGVAVYFGGKNKKMHSYHQRQLWKRVISFFSNSL